MKMATSKDSGRNLRVRARRHYNEGEHQDDEIEGTRTWNLEEKLASERFTTKWVKIMNGQDFTIKFLQGGGFDMPMLFKSTDGLGIRVPGKEFNVNDVKCHVGSRRQVDVMDVTTQKGVEMSMAQFSKYYENKERDQLYNVISLEFSHTRLEDFVEAPTIIRQIDWVDIVWPPYLKKDQRESTNTLAEMKYPKVQKYCLMSVAGCYTDFHVDFGGTSVWYHILHGKKVFWLIPPSEDNLELYENWVLSGKQSDIFLGDRVQECSKIVLEAGYTFMIPSGWIHAVYTPEDSLVFGGNVLHSFHIHRQLRVAQIEDRTHVPFKFRYPFFWEMNWFALERYVHTLTGKSFLAKKELKTNGAASDNSDDATSESMDVDKMDRAEEVDMEQETDEARSCAKAPSLSDVDDGGYGYSKENNCAPSPAETDKTEDLDEYESREPETKQTASSPVSDETYPNGGTLNGDRMTPDVESTAGCVEVKSENLEENMTVFDESPSVKTDFEAVSTEVQVEDDDSGSAHEVVPSKHVHLCRHELIGLRVLHHQLEHLPVSKRSVPELITDPEGLLKQAKEMLSTHLEDLQEVAVTGEPILKCPKPSDIRLTRGVKYKSSIGCRPTTKRLTSGIRRRRTRCRKCDNCVSDDCRECHYCKDMKKYGGPGRMKQSCVARQCLYPMLPHNAVCAICLREERLESSGPGERPGSSGVKGDQSEVVSLMECHQCNEIVHPECLEDQQSSDMDGVINSDLANSWECPKCVVKQGQDENEPNENDKPAKTEETKLDGGKPKRGRPPLKSADMKTSSLFPKSLHGYNMGFYRPGRGRDSTRIQLLAKRKVLKAKLQSLRGKRRWANVKTSEDEESVQDSDGEMEVVKDEPKVETILMEKKQPIVKPKFIIRPLPAISPPDCFPCTDERDHPLSRSVWVKVFQFLSQGDLCRCLRVCKTWNRWCYDSTLWRGVSISKTPLTKYVLAGIVRRQPTSLDLSGSKIDKQQLAWLCVRLPQLRELYLARTPPQTLSAICSADCPQLRLLDLQWVSLKDSHLAALLSPITDHRPGLVVDRTKLHKIRDLRLAGSDITDASVGLLVEQTPGLIKLDLSYCGNITDEGIGTLLAVGSTLTATLTDLNVSGCIKVTDASLIDLSRCTKLRRLIAYSCPRLTKVAWQEWAANSRVQLIIQ